MEIRNLRTFLQVASMQSFTHAAETLGYSQSNISAQIQQLEREVGAPLFDRIGRQVTLTQYGRALIPYARKIVSTALSIENFLRSEATMEGSIRVGMVESLFEMFFEPIIGLYRRRFPKVKIELSVGATSELQEQLRKSQLDLACLIDDPLPETEWVSWHAQQVKIIVVANPKNPLTEKDRVQLTELQEEEFILMEESASYMVHFRRIMADRKIAIHSFLKMQNASMARRLVESGNYMTVLPDYTVRDAVLQGRVRPLHIAEFTQTQAVQIILHKNKAITPQIHGFLEEMRTILQLIISGTEPN